jgi:hypothetical protein
VRDRHLDIVPLGLFQPSDVQNPARLCRILLISDACISAVCPTGFRL